MLIMFCYVLPRVMDYQVMTTKEQEELKDTMAPRCGYAGATPGLTRLRQRQDYGQWGVFHY